MTSLALELKKIRYMVLADFRVQMLFTFGIVLQIINITVGAASYYFLTTVFRGHSGIMEQYGTNIVSYILLGMTMNPVLMTSLTGIFTALVTTYGSRTLERIMDYDDPDQCLYTLLQPDGRRLHLECDLVRPLPAGGDLYLWRAHR